MQNQKIKIKAFIGLSLLTVGLGGCSNTIEGWKISSATEICLQRGGIDHMDNFVGSAVVCRDGFYAVITSKQ